MTVPERINVGVMVAASGLPAVGAIVFIRLGMPSKNPYDFGPKISDKNGRVVFLRDEIVREIEICQKVSPMDYSGGIAECLSIEFSILGREGIRRLIAARELWGSAVPGWRLSSGELSALTDASNNPLFIKGMRIAVAECNLSREVVISLQR